MIFDFSADCGSPYEKDALMNEKLSLEKEILMPLAGTGKVMVYQTTKWWSQLKRPGSAIYANHHYLNVISFLLLVEVLFISE